MNAKWRKQKCIHVFINEKSGKDLYFGIAKNEKEKSDFYISFSEHKKEMDERKEVMLFYYHEIWNIFETWIKKQKDMRLQYMLSSKSLIFESIDMIYLKSLQKG